MSTPIKSHTLTGRRYIAKTLFLLFLLFIACSPLFKPIITIGESEREKAISVAIQDFTTRSRLFNKDSVFIVSYIDSVYDEPTLIKIDNGKDGITHQWKRGRYYEGVIGVTISGGSYSQLYYSEDTHIGLPSRYVIVDGKLFYWRDKEYQVTDDIIKVLWKYNLLQSDSLLPVESIDESEKGVDYYFCKNDLTRFKRVITNVGFGYYKPPRLKCNCSVSLRTPH